MSPFGRSCLHVAVEADRISLVKIRRLLASRLEADRILPVELDPDRPEAGLQPLAGELASGKWQASTVRVVLSDQLVRYFVADLVPGIRSLGELQRLLEAGFEDTFGLPAADWEVSADLAPFASRFLACGASRRLLAELRRILAASGLFPASIQPFLVREFNRWRRHLPGEAAWFATTERAGLTLGCRSRKAWHGLRTYRTDGDPFSHLPMLLARDQVTYGLSGMPSRVWLAGSTSTGLAAKAVSPMAVIRLGQPAWAGRSEQWSRDYRVALAGIWP